MSGVPVVGLAIRHWVTIVGYMLYRKEWLAYRERRWRLHDEWRALQGDKWK